MTRTHRHFHYCTGCKRERVCHADACTEGTVVPCRRHSNPRKPASRMAKLRGLAFAAVLILFADGCAAKKPTLTSVRFKGCQIVEKTETALTCVCPKVVWAVDAKTGEPVALCGGKP